MPDPSPDVFRPGALFHERYHVVRCIKAGGMGAVYEVIDERTSSRRALKAMLPDILGDESMRARFAQEARVTGAIESDHVVQVFDAGVDTPTGMPFLVMELLRGDELGAMLEARGPLPPSEVRLYLAQAARALDRTHQAGIIHRDLKPENLFIARRDDGSPCLKVLDFGIAKVRSAAALAAPSRPVGTPLYMAPEQLSGGRGAGPRADLYALAQIAYTLLVGEAYWYGDLRGAGGLGRFFAKVRGGVKEPPSARAARRGVTLSAAFDGWFLKATALAAEDRFESAEALVNALATALPGSFVGSPEAALLDRSSPDQRLLTTLVEAEGERVGPFQLVHDLGHDGAAGAAPVWLAHEVYDGKRLRDVALMLFYLPEGVSPGSPEAARIHAAILDEARALCRVEHRGVARFYALHHDQARGVVALAMEHVPGPSLASRLAEAGPLTEAEVIEAGIAIAWALAAVHATGIVHRDVRPANVIHGASGYKLVHFGIAMGATGSARAPRRRSTTLAAAATTALPTGEHGGGTVALPTGEHGGGTMALPTGAHDGGTGVLATGAHDGGTGVLATGAHDGGTGALPMGEHDGGTGVLPEGAAERDAPAAKTPREPHAAEVRPVFVGAPGYLAPECGLGVAPSPGADLYALGVTLFELATGALPHGEPLPSTTPAGKALAALVATLLQEDPSSRPRHADWVARELERARALAPHPEADEGEAEPTRSARDGGVTRAGTRALDEAPPALRLPPPLVGRGPALAALARAAAEASAGAVRLALITGSMGVGRTRLLEAAVAAAGVPRGRVLMMRGSPERRGALRPLLRALDEHARAFGEEALRPLAEAARAAFTGAPRGPVRDPVEAVEDALLWASAEAPLLLAIDDLQWADAQTLDLLRLLVERAAEPSSSRLLVLAAARNEPNPEPKLRALLTAVQRRAREGVKHVVLGPLAPAEAAALAQAVAKLAPELEQAVVRGSGGVPFFIVHALSALHETGAIVFRDGALRADDPRALSGEVPGVAELVEARIASVFEPGSAAERVALRALAAIALYGGGLGIEIILRVAAGAPEDAEAALEALTSAGIVTASGERQEYGFAQEMVRQAALNLVRQRSWFYRLHRALLDALAERASSLEEAAFLADGYEKLGAAEPARAWLARAMQAASASGLFIEARELGDRLAARVTEPEAREALELDVIRALLRGRSFEEAKLRLARLAALDRGLAPTASRLRRRIYRLEAAYGLREPGAADPTLIADADALGDLALRCEARMALACVSPDDEAMMWLGEAVSLSASIGPEMEHAARALRIERNHAARRFDVALAEADLRRALAIAEATSAVWQSVILEGDLAIIEADSGRIDAAIERTARLRERTLAIGMRWQTPVFAQNLSALLLRAGRNREAAEAAARTAELAVAAGDPFLRATALSLRADALRRAGCLPEALVSVDEAEALQRERGGKSRALTLLRRAMIRDALGMREAALEDVRAARDAGERHGDPNIALGAQVWETLRLAQRGEAARGELERLVALTAEARIGLLAREIVTEARTWLESSAGPGTKARGQGEA